MPMRALPLNRDLLLERETLQATSLRTVLIWNLYFHEETFRS